MPRRKTVKLTLSATPETVERAHRLAREQNISVSALFARFIDALAGEKPKDLPPLTRKALGMAGMPSGVSERELLTDSLMEKYGLR
jgi:hypothetical protein